jgi:hypothetical protein
MGNLVMTKTPTELLLKWFCFLQHQMHSTMALGVIVTLQLLPPPKNAQNYKAPNVLALVKALTK